MLAREHTGLATRVKRCRAVAGLLKDGDLITLNPQARLLKVDVSEAEMAARRAAWTPPPPKPEARGVLAKYAKLVESAHFGATTA